MPRPVAAIFLWMCAFSTACQISNVTTVSEWVVTATADANTLLNPNGVQHVMDEATQTFSVNPMSGYQVSPTVGGTCVDGSWYQNSYTTGRITGDCTVMFASTPVGYAVTAGGTGVSIVNDSNGLISAGNSAAFRVTPNPNFTLSTSVGGTCADGTWSGNVYTTGAVNADCSVVFTASLPFYTATLSGGNVLFSDVTPTVVEGEAASVTVSGAVGFGISPVVGGDCPAGSWNGSIYNTGPLDANCTVVFTAGALIDVEVNINGNLLVTPATPVLTGDAVSLHIIVPLGSTIASINGTCPLGSLNGNVYTTGSLNANCTVDFSAGVVNPNVVDPLIRTASITPADGNATFALWWTSASDVVSSAGEQNYTLCASAPDPSAGTYALPEDVLGGNNCISMVGATAGNLTVPMGHAYYFNVVAANSVGGLKAYQPKPEVADANLVYYAPFEGNGNDVVGGLGMVVADWLQAATLPTLGVDRFGNANNSYLFDATEQSGLMTNGNVPAAVIGDAPRTLTFWASSGNNSQDFPVVLASIGGTDGGMMPSSNAFGLTSSNFADSNYLFNNGQDLVQSNVPVANHDGWHFWAVTYAPADTTVSIYRDGLRVGQSGNASGFQTPESPLFVGCGFWNYAEVSLSGWFDGKIDDLRIFSRPLCDGLGGNGCIGGTSGEIETFYSLAQ